jgi:hypothetical protein
MPSTAILALAAALIIGAASAVQASNTDRNDRGGYRVGPLGQSFAGANPAYHPSMRYGWRDYDNYVPPPRYRVPYRRYPAWGWGWDW